MSLQEISDRLEIQDLIARYSYAIDDRDWNALDDIFTPDAWIDYSEAGGAKNTLPEIKRWLPGSLERFPMLQHLTATTKLDLDGDQAFSRTILFNPIVHEDPDGSRQTFFVGLWYRDKWVRTPKGWRICERRQEMAYTHNLPAAPWAQEIDYHSGQDRGA